MLDGKIKELTTKDRDFCFEVEAAAGGKKGKKKYLFSVDTEEDLDNWVQKLIDASVNVDDNPTVMDGRSDASGVSESSSRLSVSSTSSADSRKISVDTTDDNTASSPKSESALGSLKGPFSFSSAKEAKENTDVAAVAESEVRSDPGELQGYLQKKSPRKLVGWQKRYFRLQSNGEIRYYASVCFVAFFLPVVNDDHHVCCCCLRRRTAWPTGHPRRASSSWQVCA